MEKPSILLLGIIMLLLVTSGCAADGKELDDQVYTLVLGADRGIENKVRLTVQYPTYKGGGGGGATEKKGGGGEGDGKEGVIDGTIVTTVEASSILEGVNLLNTSTTRRISLVHTKAIVFSEEFAREGIGDYLAPITRFRETRRMMQVMVCRGSAEEFIRQNKSNIGESVAKAMELMVGQADNTGFFPRTTFHEFYQACLSPYEQACAMYAGVNDFKQMQDLAGNEKSDIRVQYGLLPGEEPRVGDRKGELVGAAVFDGDRMVGTLTSYETRYLNMVTGKFKRGTITIEDKNSPGQAIPLDVRLGRKPKIQMHFEGEKPVIDVSLNIEADVGAIQSRIPYEKLNRINELNDQLATFIKNGATQTIEKTQREWGADIFGFGRKVARKFFTITEFEEYNWLSHYAEAKVNVEVKANVRRAGLMLGSAPIRYKGQKILTGGEK